LSNKIKILTLSDHPLSPSGVGTQTKYVIEALLNTGRYSVISLGGAIKHEKYTPIIVDPYGEDWKVIPVDGYGTQEMIRSIIRTEKVDIVWIMTDPRFWGWLWAMENEIRPLCPIVYYHVWDNYPYPHFNRRYYLSNDHIATISKVSDDIVKTVAPEVDSTYIPHAVNGEIFKPASLESIKDTRQKTLKSEDLEKFIFFWNNRNARRKQSGTLVWWFKEWLDKNDLHDKVQLLMHTEPKDPHGQDLQQIIEHLGLDKRQVLISTQKVAPEQLSSMYNMCDCTINISDAEGFGLATLESLSCGVPIIVNMTGGLQEQVTDGKEWFGVGLRPSSKAVIGSQDVPYIYEDRISKESFMSALSKIYFMSEQARREMGLKGREHVLKNYNFKTFNENWVELVDSIVEKHGSWENRKEYNGIYFGEVA
jgi:glycosyltransferase involved in cell wall biosynthesis